jgi:16S rRNA processing protein RimM
MAESPTKRLEPQFLMLGKIDRPHGIRGELRMRVMTDYPERVADLETIYLSRDEQGQKRVAYTLVGTRFHKDYLLLQLEDINTRNDAELLRSLFVLVDIEHAVPLDDGEFYLYQLINLQVFTENQDELGFITDVIETGANDVYVVHGERFGEVLVPAHDETIISIDFEAGQMIVSLPEGLLPELDTPADDS